MGSGANFYFHYKTAVHFGGTGDFQVSSDPSFNNHDISTVTMYDNAADDPGGDSDLTQLGNVAGDMFVVQQGQGNSYFDYDGVTDHGIIAAYLGQPYLFSDISYGPSQYVGNFLTDDPSNSSTHYFVCFATGTLIKSPRGEVAVEDLREGEDVITASGEHRPIKWIGHRRTDCAHHPRPKDVWPVLVQAGALGNATPSRDLYLTPYHAVAMTCGSEVLVPVHCLINGTTIRQVPVDEITYWHVELESHDLIVANGAAAESYLDTGNRSGFENAEGPTQLHPDFKHADDADFCRPLVTSGPIPSAIRASLPVTEIAAAA